MQGLWLTIISLQKPWLKPKAIAKRHRGGIYTAAIIKSGKNKLCLTPTKGCQTRVCQNKYIACSNTSVWHYYEQKRSGALSPLSILFVIRWHRSQRHSLASYVFGVKGANTYPIEIALSVRRYTSYAVVHLAHTNNCLKVQATDTKVWATLHKNWLKRTPTSAQYGNKRRGTFKDETVVQGRMCVCRQIVSLCPGFSSTKHTCVR